MAIDTALIACRNIYCGKLFKPSRFWSQFCSKKCRMTNASRRRREGTKLLKELENLS